MGIVGAISHSDEIALAAVARKENAAGLGLDIEMMEKSTARRDCL
ncbi:4'-phosphopantetheinyl transferase EntD [Sporomusaceae bacterium BoRhaA]|nr:4'-phosphopantetheinyl transferase EntD [Pelorhabdus rhamnosifermentans]